MKQNVIDSAQFKVMAGNGGNGRVSFRHVPGVMKGGPDGGDGGNGGSIYLVADVQMNTLKKFAGVDRFEAFHGGHGGLNNRHGKNADDMYIKVPIGTLVSEIIGADNNTVLIADLSQEGQSICIAQGGQGGRGNNALKSSTHTTPREAEPGEKGERKLIQLELKLLADIGLVGLPNVGKSSLLSVLTAARPEIANYPFTTLSPNLGVLKQSSPLAAHNPKPIIIADIPGLIEDAHDGKGLGTAFLKHIERCSVIVFVLSPETDILPQYHTVKHELEAYSPELVKKPSLIVINKCELITNKETVLSHFKSLKVNVLFTSVYQNLGLEELKKALITLLHLP